MADICVIVPSYLHPIKILQLIATWETTRTDSDLLISLESHDTNLDAYKRLISVFTTQPIVRVGTDGWLGLALNASWESVRVRGYKVYGFLGDDHRFRTPGWEARVMESIGHGGVAYGNDLLRGEDLATAAFLSADITERLGHFILPGLRHMYMDNYWMDVGRAYGNLVYMPDVIIEHMHFENGKSEIDEGYMRAASQGFVDEQVYRKWQAQGGFNQLLEAFGRTV